MKIGKITNPDVGRLGCSHLTIPFFHAVARLVLVVVILLLLLGVDAAKRGRGRARPPIRHISTNHANVEVSTSIAALVDTPPAGVPVTPSDSVRLATRCARLAARCAWLRCALRLPVRLHLPWWVTCLRGAPGYAVRLATLCASLPACACAVRLATRRSRCASLRLTARCASVRLTARCASLRLTARCACPGGPPVCVVRLAAPSCAARLPLRVHLPWWVACVCGAPALVGRLRGEPACLCGAPANLRLTARCASLCGAPTLVGHLPARRACRPRCAWLSGEPGYAVRQPAPDCAGRPLPRQVVCQKVALPPPPASVLLFSCTICRQLIVRQPACGARQPACA